MIFRTENKYYFNNYDLFNIKKVFFDLGFKKIYEGRLISSIYFENYKKQIYNDSIEGITPRKKIRFRNYPNNEEKKIFKEIKITAPESKFKLSKKISQNYLNSYLKLGYFDCLYGLCFPIIKVSYFRKYYLCNDIRLTFDSKISFTNFRTNKKIYISENVFELKYNNNNLNNKIISEIPFPFFRFSKYTLGVEKLRLI